MAMRVLSLACLFGLIGLSPAWGATVTFDGAGIKATMAAAGAPLSDATNQWGVWAIRAMPVVGGTGVYTIDSGSTTQVGWGVAAPNGAFGNPPYTPTNSVWFYDISGAEVAGTPANPLYMLMDVPADNFWSSSFDHTGTWVGDWSPGGGGTFYASGYDSGAGGTNIVTAVQDAAHFSFAFTLGSGATWDGQWQFVVDGSKYTFGSYAAPGAWVENFFGGYSTGGDLAGNVSGGFAGPAPASPIPTLSEMGLLAFGILLGLLGWMGVRRATV
jgi:IPTL-CTERM motif